MQHRLMALGDAAQLAHPIARGELVEERAKGNQAIDQTRVSQVFTSFTNVAAHGGAAQKRPGGAGLS